MLYLYENICGAEEEIFLMDNRKKIKNVKTSKDIKGIVFKIIAAILLCAFIIGASIHSSFAQFSVSDSRDKRAELQRKNEKLREMSEKLGDEISEKEKKKASLDEQVLNLMQQIEITSSKISILDSDILKLRDEIEAKKNQIENEMNLYKKKVSLIYQTGGEVSIIQMLLNCKNLKEMLSIIPLIEIMNRSTYNYIDHVEKEANELSEKTKELDKKRDDALNERNTLEQQNDELKKLCKELDDIIGELSKNKDEADHEVSLNDAEVQELDRQEAEYYRKQREEAELAAKKEQERQRANSEAAQCKVPVATPAAAPVSSMTVSSNGYCFPAPECLVVTSKFMQYEAIRGGRAHLGVDLACFGDASGKTVVAAQSGVVSFVDTVGYGGYGRYVVIDHGGGKSTLYAHMSVVCVNSGQTVERGEVIGRIGNTGHSFGAHLHFETRRYNPATGVIERYDPLTELSGYNYQIFA